MRITHDLSLAKLPGYFHPGALSRDRHKHDQSKTTATHHKELLDELFSPFAFPGGYTILFTTDDGSVLCADCAKKEYLSGIDVSCGTYDEGPTMHCDDCGHEMESSYGDPEQE